MSNKKKPLTVSPMPFLDVTNRNNSIPKRVSPNFVELMQEKKEEYAKSLNVPNIKDPFATDLIAREHRAMKKKLEELEESLNCQINFF